MGYRSSHCRVFESAKIFSSVN